MTAMYLDHFGLSVPPFRITPQTSWFFAGAQRGALLDALLYAINHDEGIVKISGEVGVGKTMLCRMLLERLPADAQVIYIANPSLAPEALLQTVALELGITDTNALTVLRQIEEALIHRYAEGKRVVTIIDEAHAMPKESLEQVRLLSNLEGASRKLIQIVLFGQPELDELLALREMRSLHDRITQHFSLAPLSEQEVAAYLNHRLEAAGYRGPDLFDRKSIRLVTQASKGLTRRINIVADKTLMAAFAQGTRNVSHRHVQLAAADARYSLPPIKGIGAPLLSATGIACVVAGVGMIAWHVLGALPAGPIATIPAPSAQGGTTTNSSDPVPSPAPRMTSPSEPTGFQSAPREHASMTSSLGPISTALLEESRQHIAQSPSSSFFIQLQRVSASDAPSLDGFLQRARTSLNPAQLRLYQATVDGRIRYGVIFGDYATVREATIAIAKMPDWIRASGVYPRQYSALQ